MRGTTVAREAAFWMVGLAWLLAVAGGFWAWERYDTTPGADGTPTAQPEEASGHWRLTVFAHPRCPCTRAALEEAAGLVAAAPELRVRVLFVRPPGTRAGWENSASWTRAAQIPNAEVLCDAEGVEARRNGAATSGLAVLTDPTGKVVFRGGLTASRGRAGENVGRRSILDWVGGRTGTAEAPVFGCPLLADE